MKIRFAVIAITWCSLPVSPKEMPPKPRCALLVTGRMEIVNPIWPNLAGQGAEYTVQQLNAFKTKKRNNAIMWPFASNLTEEDMWD